jgi:16S rRNA (adenine1518-N6/adenine1519-N6)-dimethyltransferase
MVPEKIKDQHIMIDSRINEMVVNAAQITSSDAILEIGGGPGNLTELLAKHAQILYSVEKDKEYLSILNKKFVDAKNVKIIPGSILDVKLPKFNKIVSNPPYQILQSFFFRLVKENKQDFECCVMIVPNKFTKLITNNPENLDSGVLSALFYAFYDVEIIEKVPKEAFDPMPRVTSYIIRVTKKKSNGNRLRIFLENIFLGGNKKIRNVILNALWNRGEIIINRKLTKKEARALVNEIDALKIASILDKNIFQLSNDEIRDLSKALLKISN